MNVLLLPLQPTAITELTVTVMDTVMAIEAAVAVAAAVEVIEAIESAVDTPQASTCH